MKSWKAALFGAGLALIVGLMLWLPHRERRVVLDSRTSSPMAAYPVAALPRRPAPAAPTSAVPIRAVRPSDRRPAIPLEAADAWQGDDVPRYVSPAVAAPPEHTVVEAPQPLLITPEGAALDWHPLPGPSPGQPPARAARPRALAPMYASFATLQVLDAYASWDAVNDRRGREANPVLRGVADDMPQMLVAKGASTAVSIIAVEHLWKRNRTAAVATMIGINAAYVVVVAHNLSAGR